MTKQNKTMQSLNKAMDMLDYFTKHREAGITQISKDLHLPKSTVHYILSTFKERGFIAQDSESRKYRLGVKTYQVASHWDPGDLDTVSHAYVKQLSDELGEIVLVSIMLEDQALIVDRCEPTPPFVIIPQVRYTMPLHCTAAGKLLLANSTEETLDIFLSGKRLIKNTVNTISDIPKLKKELRQIFKQGYSLDNEEMFRGVRCCAAPVRDSSGKVVAALSIMHPADKYRSTDYMNFVQRVVKQAESISIALGYSGAK